MNEIINIDDSMTPEEIAQEAESLCRWGAARAGVIVIAPLLGTMALIANEVYMIKKIAELYGYEFKESMATSFIGALGGAFVGQTLVTLIPFAPMQVPIAIGVTYGLGKAANVWIKDGMPDLAECKDKYLSIFKSAKEDAKELIPLLKESPLKDKALGDENKKFNIDE